MKTILEDPHAFFAEGGWDFVAGGGDVSSDHNLGRLAEGVLKPGL